MFENVLVSTLNMYGLLIKICLNVFGDVSSRASAVIRGSSKDFILKQMLFLLLTTACKMQPKAGGSSSSQKSDFKDTSLLFFKYLHTRAIKLLY